MILTKKLYSIIICFALITSSLQGDILKCMKDISTVIGEAELIVKDIENKAGMFQIANDILAITATILHLIDDCNNPINMDAAMKKCVTENPATGCEQWGAIIYPKCKAGFYNVACCICSHTCPQGFRDDGLYCGKPEPYGRGAGFPWQAGDEMNLNEAKKRCERVNPIGCEPWYIANYFKGSSYVSKM